MPTTQCPLCGHQSLDEHHGDYVFEPPANVPGGVIVVADSTWFACSNCGEHILPHPITAGLEAEIRNRRLSSAPVSISP